MICLLLWVSIIISLLLRVFIMICLLNVLIMICLLLRVLIMIRLSTEKKLDMKHERDRMDRPVFILVLVFVLFYEHNKER
jgi:uncharacterized membrane protein